MGKTRTVSVVLPAWNEEGNIASTTDKCLKAFEKYFEGVEIIIVDDGSSDRTAEISQEICAADSRVKIERHPKNRGYGAALRTGFAAGKNEWVFFMDSDGQFDPEEISIMIPHLDDNDMVAGYRMNRQDGLYRRMMGWGFSKSVYLFFGTGLKDIDCAFKFLRGESLRKLPLKCEDALINTELLFHARKRNWRIHQIGVHHYPRTSGEQTGGKPFVVLKAGLHYWYLFCRLHLEE